MTDVCITYRMERESEVAETRITLPMDDIVATMLVDTQGDCFLLMAGGPLTVLLRELSQLQGYTYTGFCCAARDEH